MDNHIMLGGKKIEISKETADNLRKQFTKPVHVPKHGDVVWHENNSATCSRRIILKIDGKLGAYDSTGNLCSGTVKVTSKDFEAGQYGLEFPIYTFKYNIFD